MALNAEQSLPTEKTLPHYAFLTYTSSPSCTTKNEAFALSGRPRWASSKR